MESLIKHEDIKLGNYVLHQGELCYVTGLNDDLSKSLNWVSATLWSVERQCLILGNPIYICNLEGIRLNESLIKKCGFIHLPSGVLDEMDWDEFEIDDNLLLYNEHKEKDSNGDLKFYFEYGCPAGKIEIKFLHDLQNLWYTLKGTRLLIDVEKLLLT